MLVASSWLIHNLVHHANAQPDRQQQDANIEGRRDPDGPRVRLHGHPVGYRNRCRGQLQRRQLDREKHVPDALPEAHPDGLLLESLSKKRIQLVADPWKRSFLVVLFFRCHELIVCHYCQMARLSLPVRTRTDPWNRPIDPLCLTAPAFVSAPGQDSTSGIALHAFIFCQLQHFHKQ